MRKPFGVDLDFTRGFQKTDSCRVGREGARAGVPLGHALSYCVLSPPPSPCARAPGAAKQASEGGAVGHAAAGARFAGGPDADVVGAAVVHPLQLVRPGSEGGSPRGSWGGAWASGKGALALDEGNRPTNPDKWGMIGTGTSDVKPQASKLRGLTRNSEMHCGCIRAWAAPLEIVSVRLQWLAVEEVQGWVFHSHVLRETGDLVTFLM